MLTTKVYNGSNLEEWRNQSSSSERHYKLTMGKHGMQILRVDRTVGSTFFFQFSLGNSIRFGF